MSKASDFYRGAHGCAYHELVMEPQAKRAAACNLPLYTPFVRADDTVLDFGCGSGHLLAALPAVRRIGIEVNPVSARQAAGRGIEVHEELSEVQARSVNAAVSQHALEHALAPYEELSELRRVLRPGGVLVLTLPLDDWRERHERGPWAEDPDHHLFAWTPLTISNLLSEAGFTVADARVIGRSPVPQRAARVRRIVEPLWVPSGASRVYAAVRKLRQIHAVARTPS